MIGLKETRQIERETGKTIRWIGVVEYEMQNVGNYRVPVAYQRVRLAGEKITRKYWVQKGLLQ